MEAVTEHWVEAFAVPIREAWPGRDHSPDPQTAARGISNPLDCADPNCTRSGAGHRQTHRGLGLYEEAVRLLERCRDLVDQMLSPNIPIRSSC